MNKCVMSETLFCCGLYSRLQTHKQTIARVVLTVCCLMSIDVTHAVGGLPGGFYVETIASGLDRPTAMAFSPDGRLFVAEKAGVVKIIQDGRLLPTPFIALPDVNDYWDRGLIGLALDPDFASNQYLYLAYTYENDSSNHTAAKTARVVRVTANGNTAAPGSELVILGTVGGSAGSPSCNDYPLGTDCIASDSTSHTIGGLRFGPDRKLYVATGDGAGFEEVDSHAFYAQNLDHLSGKILRINKDGTAVSDNPFYNGDPQANRSKVFAYGFRNPYRFSIHPATGVILAGDVGWYLKEEINRVVRGGNYGWPCREGSQAAKNGYELEPNCPITTATVDPVYEYDHVDYVGAITGGTFINASQYPEYFGGAFLFGDYTLDFIKFVRFDSNFNVVSVNTLASSGVGAAVEFKSGNDGLIYYVAIGTGEVRRINYSSTGLGTIKPVAEFNAQVTLTPQFLGEFNASASYDPAGKSLNYVWDFGDGQSGSGITTTHQYASEGIYPVSLSVTTERGTSATVKRDVVFDTSQFANLAQPSLISIQIPEGNKFVGLPLTFEIMFGNQKTGSPFEVLVEILDDNDMPVDQKIISSVSLPAGETMTIDHTWFPAAVGRFAISVGFYTPGFTSAIRHHYRARELQILNRNNQNSTCVDEGNGDNWGVNPATNEGCWIIPPTNAVCVDEGNGDNWGVNLATNEGCWIVPPASAVCVDEGNGDNWGVNPATNEGCWIVPPASAKCVDEGNGDNWGVNPATNEGCWIVPPTSAVCVDEGNGDNWGVNLATNEGCWIVEPG